MKVYGFLTTPALWGDAFNNDPNSPEESICEACHLYEIDTDISVVGFDVSLGLSVEDMDSYLADFSETRKVYTLKI